MRVIHGRWWLAVVPVVVLAGAIGAWAIKGRGPRYDRQTWSDIEHAAAAKRWGEFEARLDRWVKLHPGDGNAWVALGSYHLAGNRASAARMALERVAPADRAWTVARGMLGELAFEQHDAPAAERSWREAAATDPRAIGPRQRLVNLLSLELRTGEARDALWELYRLNRDPRALVDLVVNPLIAEQDLRGLDRELERFLKNSPDDPFVRRAWGLALLAQGRPTEALPHLEAAAREFSCDPVGRYALAECVLGLGRDPRTAIALLGPEPPPRDAPDPERAQWLLLRARLEEARGDDLAALATLRAAVAANPGLREAQFRLGNALVRHGDQSKAAAHHEQAEAIRRRERTLRREHERVRREGLTAERCEALSALCRESGLVREARAWLEQAIRLEPARTSAQRAIAALPADSATTREPFFVPWPVRIAASATAPIDSDTIGSAGDPPCPIRFEDIAARAGISFTYDCAARGDLFIGDTMGGGVGLIDYDHDGFLDIYFINGAAWPRAASDQPAAPNRLYHNRHDGTFEDVTARAQVGGRGYGMGCAVGDYDRDGHDDLFVTGLGATVLYRNRGDGTFQDVTDKAGVNSSLWTTAAGFADLDGDGDLDLMVVTYVDADPAQAEPCRDNNGGRIHCSPSHFPAQPDLLFRNNGDGTFTDVSQQSGIAAAADGRGLGLAIADFDGDNLLDVFVANDASANFLFKNLGGLKFAERGSAAGVAFDGSGRATASMGVAADDFDGDGLIDLFHTNFLNEPNTLRRNLGHGLFADTTLAANLAAASLAKTGFGVAALDADNDGLLDLFISNGHVDDQPWIATPMAQRPLLHWGRPTGRFALPEMGDSPYFSRAVVGRGVAAGDLDNDGRIDLVVVHRDTPVAILHNITTEPGHWLGVRLSPTRSTTPAVGTRLVCRAGGRSQTRWVSSGTGYLSAHDSRIWFGLGPAAATVDRLDITWPSGKTQSLQRLKADQIVEVVEEQP